MVVVVVDVVVVDAVLIVVGSALLLFLLLLLSSPFLLSVVLGAAMSEAAWREACATAPTVNITGNDAKCARSARVSSI